MGKKQLVLEEIVKAGDAGEAGAFLFRKTGLSLLRIQDALAKGALRLKRRGQKRFRLRRGEILLGAGDDVVFYYDEEILARVPPEADLVEDRKDYSVWFKPPGLMTQGSPRGDHCSLERQEDKNVSEIDVTLHTGRLHQIRRHFEAIGCPVLGDPRYGKGNKNREGLKVNACSLCFTCPVSGKEIIVRHSPDGK